MNIFPVSFPLEDKSVLVIGGGEEARRKVRLLAKTPAQIFAVWPSFDHAYVDEFSDRAAFARRTPVLEDFQNRTLAVIAVNNRAEAELYRTMARTAGVPVNVVDQPDLCDWYTPAIVDRGSIVISVASGGTAPVVARWVRERIETLIPSGIGRLARIAKTLRPEVAENLPRTRSMREFWERVLRGPALDQANAGNDDAVASAIRRELAQAGASQGVVHLVGAGPGDPDLLTVKALRLLQEADIVLYDALVSDDVLDLIRRDADRVYVGKRKADHAVPQDQIVRLMITAAEDGKRVVRLKGGDPFVFGRGGEELEGLQAAGIEVSVVPGISAALGCAASAGIPLTHRDKAQAVTFVTGHAQSGEPDLDWTSLARTNQTVVVFMGVGTAGRTASHLIDAGRAPTTPVAVIENGTTDREIKAFGELFDLPDLISRNGIRGPALLIIGDVAARTDRAKLSSFIEDLVQ